MRLHPLLGAALALAFAGPAAAAVTVMGDSNATLCSRAAFAELGTYDSLRLCTAALSAGMLDRHDLAGTYINRGVIYMVRLDYKSARADFECAITAIDRLIQIAVRRFSRRARDAVKKRLRMDRPPASW